MFNIYIVHYDLLVERKQNMINQLINLGYKYTFISNKGQSVITDKEKSKFNTIKIAEISLFLHHIEAMKEVVNPLNKNKFNLILEDDAILHSKFDKIITTMLPRLPEDWDMFFIGNGCNLHAPYTEGKHIYKVHGNNSLNLKIGPTRCADSYFISKKCANLALSRLNLPNYLITMPIDHWLNAFIKHNNLNIYWLEPTIVQQGSELGTYNTSLDHTIC